MFIGFRNLWKKIKHIVNFLFVVAVIALVVITTVFTGGAAAPLWIGLATTCAWTIVGTWALGHVLGSIGNANYKEKVNQINADPSLTEEEKRQLINELDNLSIADDVGYIGKKMFSMIGQTTSGLLNGLGLPNLSTLILIGTGIGYLFLANSNKWFPFSKEKEIGKSLPN